MHLFIDLSEEDLADPVIERLSHGKPLLVIGEKRILLSEEQLEKLSRACVRGVIEKEAGESEELARA